MSDKLKLYSIDFEPMWGVPCGLIILARSKKEANEIAKKTVTHTKIIGDAELIHMNKSKVVFYESGNY